MPRLFTGLEIPSDLALDLASLRGGISGARWIDSDNYHMTLRFIGDIDDATARDVFATLEQIKRPPFTVTIEG
ncbi:MAG: 2'-5' RNA ligase family protein, partial [Methylovirgula sp.]